MIIAPDDGSEILTGWHPPDPDHLFSLIEPDRRLYPFLLNSPHSGDCFPDDFLERSQLSRESLRRASDLYVDLLLAPVVTSGVPLMRAHAPRAFLDLNREPLELDPRLIAGALPKAANHRSLRVAAGLGTVPRLVGDGIEIYCGKLSLSEVEARIAAFYVPYHQRLVRELGQIHAAFGQVVLVDCHSMPSTALGRDRRPLPDIVLGDRYGTSCSPAIMDRLETLFFNNGLRVERNQPYAGGFNTEHYGRPVTGWHAIQIEINRALYMDEVRQELHAGYPALSSTFTKILGDAFEICTSDLHFMQRGLHFTHRAAE